MFKILLADDEKMELEALTDILTRAYGDGIRLFRAEKGTDAVRLACENGADVVIMDIKMPGMNGLDASKEILSKLPDCKIIIHTGYTYFSYARECVKIGAVGLLVKPCVSEEIVSAVDKAMEEVERSRTERSHLLRHEEKLQVARSYAKREIVASIVYSAPDDSDIQAYLDMLDVSFSAAVAGLVYCPDREEGRRRAFFQRIEGILDGERRAVCCYYERSARLYYLVFEDGEESGAASVVNEIERACAGESGCRANHSQAIRHLSDLFGAFSALRVLKARGEAGEPSLDAATQYRIEEKMCADLREKKFLESMRELEVLMDSIAASGQSVRQRFLGLMILMQRSVFDLADVPDAYARYPMLEDCIHAHECKRVVADYAVELIDCLSRKAGSPETDWITATRTYLEENYSQNLSLDEVAHRVSFSPFYFSKLFKKTFGRSFIEYITHLRIKQAMALLADENVTVREVSDLVGFSEPNYFTRVFKKETGQTPTNYQKNAVRAKKC